MKLQTSWATRPLSSQASAALEASLDLVAEPMAAIEKKLYEQGTCFQSGIEKYVEYACGSSGKRLRPFLALLAGGATGNITSEHHDLALILELIHIASLVHDDIMDGAEVRRDRPTLNAKWGNGITVLVGDILFAHALRLATHFSKTEICRRIVDAALDVCSGEILQTERRFDSKLTLENYYRMVEMKTGSLFAVACELGAMLNESAPEVVDALKNYGNKIGTAYQLLDDCIDLVGDEKVVGKTLGTDLLSGKFTLPVLMLLQHSSKEEQETLCQSLLNHDGITRQELVTMLLEHGAFKKAIAETRRLIDEAESALAPLAENNYVTGLRGMVLYLRGVLETL